VLGRTGRGQDHADCPRGTPAIVNPRRSVWRMPTTTEYCPQPPAAAGPELWMQRRRGFSAMNSRTRSLPAPIFIRFIRCTLKTDRFVLAVIPSRKRFTQKISVRFAPRPVPQQYVRADPCNSEGHTAWTISTCFLTQRSLSSSLQAIPQHRQWSTPLSQTGPRRTLKAPQRHHRERHEGAAALGPSRADRPSYFDLKKSAR
jgi:hypothetical protein